MAPHVKRDVPKDRRVAWHANSRARERYGRVSADTKKAIVRLIRKFLRGSYVPHEECHCVGSNSSRRRFRVRADGRSFMVVYETASGRLITFLPDLGA